MAYRFVKRTFGIMSSLTERSISPAKAGTLLILSVPDDSGFKDICHNKVSGSPSGFSGIRSQFWNN